MSGFLDNLKSSFSLSKKAPSSVIGVDISSSAIKLVQLTKQNNKALLETYGEIALGPYGGIQIGRAVNTPTDKIVEAFSDLLREAKTTTDSVGVSIPASASLLRIIKMPNVGEEKLKQMVPIEIRKYIPVPVTEVLLDWQVLPQSRKQDDEENGDVEVLVAAIHNDVLTRYQDIVTKVGLKASFYEIEIFSTARAVLDKNREPSMIVDIGAATTKVYIVERGIIRASRIINAGSQNITLSLSSALGVSVDEAEALKRSEGLSSASSGSGINSETSQSLSVLLSSILSEARGVMDSYQEQHQNKISKVVFSGGGTIIGGLLENAHSVFETEVVIADPFSRIDSPPFLEPVLRKAGPEFAVAIGLGLRKLEEN